MLFHNIGSNLVVPLGLPVQVMQYIAQYLCTQPLIGPICATIVYQFVGTHLYPDDPVIDTFISN